MSKELKTEHPLIGKFKYKESKELSVKAYNYINKLFEIDIANKSRQRTYINARLLYYKIMQDNCNGESMESISESLGFNHATLLNANKKSKKVFEKFPRLYDDYIKMSDSIILRPENGKFINEEGEGAINSELVVMLQKKTSYISKLENEKNILMATCDKLVQEKNELILKKHKTNPEVIHWKSMYEEKEKECKMYRKEYNDISKAMLNQKSSYGS